MASTRVWKGRELALDAAIAAVVFGASVALLGARGDAHTHDLDALGIALAALASWPLVLRRREPLAVFAVTAAASSVLFGLGYPPGPPLGPTIALFFLGLHPEQTRAPRWLTALVVGGLYLIHTGATGIAHDEFPTVQLLFGAVVWGGAWVVGDRVRGRRGRIAELEERLRQAEREAERERRLAAAEERTRIARDLHDSAGHAINVILVQAGAARLLGNRDPEHVQEALATIEEVARETIGELDQLVRVLREGDPSGAVESPVEPPPGLAALATLAERHRSAGLAVEVRTHGPARPLGPGVDQAAYRILQEAMTNAARHGDGTAEVDITFGPNSLDLAVTNPTGPDESQGGAGHGIVGMRERAALLGGTLATAADNGVFRVRVTLPYGGEGR
jgi:signal transduction histidine kinase